MTSESQVAKPPGPRRLLWLTLAAFAVGTFVVLCFVLPAEFGVDLTGFGRVTQVNRLAPMKQVAAPTAGAAVGMRPASSAFRTDVIEIPLADGLDVLGSELEYKVRMKEGDSLVYSWEVAAPAEEFYYDMHSQSDPNPDVKVMSFKADLGNKLSGSLIAPFSGLHGWYFQNQSIGAKTVRLHLAGFYTLVSREELTAAAAAAPPAFGPPPETQ